MNREFDEEVKVTASDDDETLAALAAETGKLIPDIWRPVGTMAQGILDGFGITNSVLEGNMVKELGTAVQQAAAHEASHGKGGGGAAPGGGPGPSERPGYALEEVGKELQKLSLSDLLKIAEPITYRPKK